MTDTLTSYPAPASPWALVRARLARIHADSTDQGDNPDWAWAEGEIGLLVPSIEETALTYTGSDGRKTIIEVSRVEVTIGADGWLCTTDGEPVRIAATDDDNMSATGWLWTLMIGKLSVCFPAPAGSTVEVADYITAPATSSSTRYWVDRIPELIDAARSLAGIDSVTGDGQTMTVTLTDGTTTTLPLPGAPVHAPDGTFAEGSAVSVGGGTLHLVRMGPLRILTVTGAQLETVGQEMSIALMNQADEPGVPQIVGILTSTDGHHLLAYSNDYRIMADPGWGIPSGTQFSGTLTWTVKNNVFARS